MKQIQPKSYVDSVVYKIIEDRIKDAENRLLEESAKLIFSKYVFFIGSSED